MALTLLRAATFRNIQFADLNFSTELNIICGENGAGKTSLLEAIYFLLNGKSFRTNVLAEVLTDGETLSQLLGEGEFLNSSSFSKDKVACNLHLRPASKDISWNNEKLRSASQLAKKAPSFYFSPTSLDFVLGDPQYRRDLINWVMFHVEHNYGDTLKQYNKALKQRNSSLKNISNSSETEFVWRKQLVSYSCTIHQYRKTHLKNIIDSVESYLSKYEEEIYSNVRFNYLAGWDEHADLGVLMQNNLEKDTKFGSTSLGCHRAELQIKFDSKLSKKRLSRGQTKIVSLMFVFACLDYVRNITGNAPIFLLDDVFSELDSRNRLGICDMIDRFVGQIFITLPTDSPNIKFKKKQEIMKMFHVEHGIFTEVKDVRR